MVEVVDEGVVVGKVVVVVVIGVVGGVVATWLCCQCARAKSCLWLFDHTWWSRMLE